MAPVRSDTTRSLELDFHLDFPPKPDSVQGKQERARIAFNKVVDARYQDGSSGYVEVGVLLVHWVEDDLDVKAEVSTPVKEDALLLLTNIIHRSTCSPISSKKSLASLSRCTGYQKRILVQICSPKWPSGPKSLMVPKNSASYTTLDMGATLMAIRKVWKSMGKPFAVVQHTQG